MNDQPFSLDKALTAIPEPGNDRNRLIAETWMGWRHAGDREPLRLFKTDGGYIRDGSPQRFEGNGVASGRYFDPSFDIAAAYQMEEAIAKAGRTTTYAQALAVVFLENKIPEHEEDMWFLFAHATPEQRSKAALVAWMKGVSHPQEGE